MTFQSVTFLEPGPALGGVGRCGWSGPQKQRGTFPCTQATYVCCVTCFFYYCVTDSLLVATLGQAHRRATIQHVMTQRMRPGALRGMPAWSPTSTKSLRPTRRLFVFWLLASPRQLDYSVQSCRRTTAQPSEPAARGESLKRYKYLTLPSFRSSIDGHHSSRIKIHLN
jgi:hypothetical protein